MKMKIPNNPVGNGYPSQDVNVIPYLSDNSDSNTDEADSPIQDGDFSEYLWMQNMEEFDSQVMKQLEEEALMEQCIEAMLEDEREGALAGQAPHPPPCQTWSTAETALSQAVEALCVTDDLAKGSKLNPNATEFVPREPAAAPIEGNA